MIKRMKDLMDAYKITAAQLDGIEARCDESPDDEELEEAWDAAYKMHFDVYMELAETICKVSMWKIDEVTARAMINKKWDALEALVARFA